MQSNASVNEEFIDLIDEIKPPTGNIHLKYKTPLNSYVRDFLINLPKFNEIKFFINNDIIRLECKIIDYDNDRFRYINYEINDFDSRKDILPFDPLRNVLDFSFPLSTKTQILGM